MRYPAGVALLLLTIGAINPSVAAERRAVCREPTVLDEIACQVRAANYYGSVDPGRVTEQPTADPRVVHCQVCVLSAPYDTTRFGERPIDRCVARGFAVRILTSGFVVRDLR